MAVLAHDLAAVTATPEAEPLAVEVFDDLAAAEPLWRRLEAEPSLHATPYQRFDWVAAYLAGFGGAVRVVVLRDAAGRARLLLPLTIGREAGLRVARTVGAKHANFHLPLTVGAPLGDAGAIRAALREAGRRTGADLVALDLQPTIWEGRSNPLAVGGEPSASDAYGMVLEADAEATVRRVFGADARKKLRQKERRLVELVGPVEHRRAGDAAEVARVLAAFHAQKAARFAALGLDDPFAAPGARTFLEAACLAGLAEGRPAAELHALVAARDGRVLAVYAGAVDTRRFSGMVTSFDADPEIARGSPGDQLLVRLVRDQAARGRTALDLGVGEARYKASTCAVVVPLVESVVAVTPLGRLGVEASRLRARARRFVKRTPWALALAKRLRRR